MAGPFRRWRIERPLGDVRNVAMKQLYVGRGQHLRPVHIVFADETSVLAWSPAAYMIQSHLARVAELRAFLGLPEPGDDG